MRTASKTPAAFQDYVDDLLGMRIICLRRSDVDRVETFLDSLKREKKLVFHKGPEHKQTFPLRIDPRAELPPDVELQYSGYSSVHYVLSLGKALQLSEELCNLRAELQIRTLLEEAWGEIDHKYRYELARTGVKLPDHITLGFYSFGAYLQAAALQAEYLCMEVDKIHAAAAPQPAEGQQAESIALERPGIVKHISDMVFDSVGFRPTKRTINYITRRLRESQIYAAQIDQLRSHVLPDQIVNEFRDIYRDVAKSDPFVDRETRDVDLINALNFSLTRSAQGPRIARAGVEDRLRRRLKTDYQYGVVFDDVEIPNREISTRFPIQEGTSISFWDLPEQPWIVSLVEPLEDSPLDARLRMTRDTEQPNSASEA